MLAVNLRESAPRVAEWAKAEGVTVPILLDPDGAVGAAYRVTGTPTVVLIDRGGKMVARGVGTRSWDTGHGRALLDALVATPPR